MNIDLTIVIPTKNESSNIKNILHDLKNQHYLNGAKIILSDAFSIDKTRFIAEECARQYNLNLCIIDGGLPAYGRNCGAKMATTKYILFIDSDIRIYDELLIRYCIYLAGQNNYWLVTTNTYCNSKSVKSRFAYWASSRMQILSKWIWKPFSTGMFMLVERDAFFKYGMFDENALYCEDYLFSKKIPREKFKVYTDSAIYTSDRRLHKMGYVNMVWLFLKTIVNTWNLKFFYKNHNYWS